MKPDVTAVIVNWNRKNDVIALLNSVSLLEYPSLTVLVVDNASTDDSVSAIKVHPLNVILIENTVNLGGTGGFNTGLRYALENLEQEYIWLLDNDATVDLNALSTLVETLQQDHSIAVAGSKILNAHDPAYIVETGARVDWRTASVLPINRNAVNLDNNPVLYDVEYVAICSALFRVSALKRVGIMDERYFLLWDDMDWGVSFSQAGYRVVAVNHSLIYHPPFTEKRSLAVDNYYGIRNCLLTISKRTRGIDRILAVLALCRRACRIHSLAFLDGNVYAMALVRHALADFLSNRWGKLALDSVLPLSGTSADSSSIEWSSLTGKLLILNSGSVDVINCLAEQIAANCTNKVTIDVVVQEDRRKLLKMSNLSDVITVDFESRNALVRNLLVFIRLARKRYTYTINPSGDKISPFAYVAQSAARLDQDTNKLVQQKAHSPWGVLTALFGAEAAAAAIFPAVYWRSVMYGKS